LGATNAKTAEGRLPPKFPLWNDEERVLSVQKKSRALEAKERLENE